MKNLLLSFFIISAIFLTGCSEKITLDNIENIETDYLYSSVILNTYIKETGETKIITEAKDFTSKFIAVQQNKSFNEKTTATNETIMYTEEYKEKHKDIILNRIEYVKDFYARNRIETEVQSIDYKKIINLNGDAFVHAVSKVRLTKCDDIKVAQLLGYSNGVNSNIICEYNIKLKYVDGEYFVYDYEILEKDGQLKQINAYEKLFEDLHTAHIEENSSLEDTSEEKELRTFIYNLAYAQTNRDYKVFKGDEDYKYLSESYKEELNKLRDDVKYTKFVYSEYQINTQFLSCYVTDIKKNGDVYTVKANVKSKLLECVSDEVARNIGYPNGVGSEATLGYTYTVGKENGSFKLLNSSN